MEEDEWLSRAGTARENNGLTFREGRHRCQIGAALINDFVSLDDGLVFYRLGNVSTSRVSSSG